MRKISDSNIAFYSFSEVKTFDPTSKEVLQVENNGWISVKDRLPNKGDKVLIFRDVRKWDEKRIPLFLITQTK